MSVYLPALLMIFSGAILAASVLFCCHKSPFIHSRLLRFLRFFGATQLLGHERALIDSVQDLIWLKDLKGRYVSVNRAFLENYRKSRRDIEGHTDHELFPPALAELYCAQDRRVLMQGDLLPTFRTS